MTTSYQNMLLKALPVQHVTPGKSQRCPSQLGIGILQTQAGDWRSRKNAHHDCHKHDQKHNQKHGYGAFNLGFHVGDAAQHVHSARTNLLDALAGVRSIHWLNQVHGTHVVNLDADNGSGLHPQKADALLTTQQGLALAIMTADCIPLVLVSKHGEQIAAVHAGWRGLAAGVVEKTIAAMCYQPAYAWVGAFISQAHFEVGGEVKAAFTAIDARYAQAFLPVESSKVQSSKAPLSKEKSSGARLSEVKSSKDTYMADMRWILEDKLKYHNISTDFLGACSYGDERFYSYRRDGACTGRMATLVYKLNRL